MNTKQIAERVARSIVAQHLVNVKTLDTLTERELTRAIRDAIIAEEGAINQYETIVDSTTNEKAMEALQDIADEERVHVGELQALLAELLPDEHDKLDEGASEVEKEKRASVIRMVVRRLKAQENPFGLDKMAMDVAEFFAKTPDPDDDKFHAWAEKKGLNVHKAEAAAYILATAFTTFFLNGKANEKGFTEADADKDELAKGIKVEMEHTSSKEMATRIAIDHLAEISDYYTRLKKMEEDAGIKD